MYTITKGELWTIRQALEERDSEAVTDAHTIINGILEKNVTIDITEDQMYKDPLNEKLNEEELEIIESEEEHRYVKET